MKVKELKMVFDAQFARRPDDLNRTTVRLNGRVIWPVDENGVAPNSASLREGLLSISIPSGVLEGKIWTFEPGAEQTRIWLRDATWEGRAGGLAGGLCAIGKFEVLNPDSALVTESSALGSPVSYRLYEAVRDLGAGLEPAIKARAMEEVFEVLEKYGISGT